MYSVIVVLWLHVAIIVCCSRILFLRQSGIHRHACFGSWLRWCDNTGQSLSRLQFPDGTCVGQLLHACEVGEALALVLCLNRRCSSFLVCSESISLQWIFIFTFVRGLLGDRCKLC